MKDRTNRYLKDHWLWWTITILLLVGTIIVSKISLQEEEDGPPSQLYVEEVYFVMTDQNEETTYMDIMVFVTNNGDKSLSDVKVRAFAVEIDSNLARDENEKSMGEVKGQTTVEGTLNIALPNNDSYRVELLVFKEGKLSIRGSGTVNLKGVGTASDYETEKFDGDGGVGGFMDAEDGDGSMIPLSSSSGPCGFFLVITVLILIVVIVILVWKNKKKGNDGNPPQFPGHW